MQLSTMLHPIETIEQKIKVEYRSCMLLSITKFFLLVPHDWGQ